MSTLRTSGQVALTKDEFYIMVVEVGILAPKSGDSGYVAEFRCQRDSPEFRGSRSGTRQSSEISRSGTRQSSEGKLGWNTTEVWRLRLQNSTLPKSGDSGYKIRHSRSLATPATKFYTPEVWRLRLQNSTLPKSGDSGYKILCSRSLATPATASSIQGSRFFLEQ